MEIITLREFARRIGVSLTAVQNGAKSGRIDVFRDDAGKITGIDWSTQEAAWSENSKAPQRRPHNPGGGRPRNDGLPPAAPATRRPQEGEVTEHLEAQPHGGALKRAATEPPPKGEMTLAQIQRARELVKLQIDNEALKKAKGESVSRAEVYSEGAKLAGTIISALYNIPERISDDLAGMTDPHKIAELLTREINDAVASIRQKYGN
jgi:hypothetical protein